MKHNVGSVDRSARMILGAAGVIEGYLSHNLFLGIAGVIVLLSGTAGFCPLYTLFGLNTCERGRS